MSLWRTIAAALLASISLLLAACGGDEEEKSPPPSAVGPVPETPPARPDAPPPITQIPAPNPKDPIPPDTSSVPSPPENQHALLTFAGTDPIFAALILQSAEAKNLPLQKITIDQFKTAPQPGFTSILVPLPIPQTEIPILPSNLILVGIPDSTSTLPPHRTLIRPDYLAYGKTAGQTIIAHLARLSELGGRAHIAGNIVQIRASDEDPASIPLFDGFLPELEKHASVVFVHDGPGFWRQADAQKRMEEALRIQKNITLVFAHSTTMASGAKTAIAAHRQAHPDQPEIPIISIGGKEGPLSFSPLAEKAVETATRLAADPNYSPPPEIAVPPDLSP